MTDPSGPTGRSGPTDRSNPTGPSGPSGSVHRRRRPDEHLVRRRREARERAFELAYEAEIRNISIDDLLAPLPLAPDPFTIELLRSAEQLRDEAEALIAERASGWSLDRMPVIDLVVMRLATAELLKGEAPTGVVLAEAVDLASRYSTDESGRFVNGVLAAIARHTRPDG